MVSMRDSSSLSAHMGTTAAPNSGWPWWDKMRCWSSTDFSSGTPSSSAARAAAWAPITRWPRSCPFTEYSVTSPRGEKENSSA